MSREVFLNYFSTRSEKAANELNSPLGTSRVAFSVSFKFRHERTKPQKPFDNDGAQLKGILDGSLDSLGGFSNFKDQDMLV
jgi:hypothetical protein